ncbi:MAG: FAD-dependent oxidoreductase [Candidatus Binatia bacterium]|jgi:heterodisulfide reductase subunit A-like polyferredoxin
MTLNTQRLVPSSGANGKEPCGAVLICGAGIAGIQASLDLAESGFKVYLLEPSLAIGGKMAMLDKTFPTGDCAMCIISPKLVAVGRNENIEIITLAEVEKISGEAGNFEVVIRQRPRYVDSSRCNACGDCAEACPVTLPSEFDRGLGGRKAIFRPYPQAIPNVFGIVKSERRAPCKAACPAGVNVQGYVALLAKGKIKEAYDVIRERCPLPAVCGRICQHPCETRCNRKDLDEPVSARDLKRFAADYVYAHREEIQDVPPQPAAPQKEKVAVIGGGPAGLTAAVDLRMLGYAVTVFDANPLLGGMLRYGIPRYRLPADVLDHEIQYLLDMGIEAKTSTRLTDPAKLLKSSAAADGNGSEHGEFNAVFAAVGAWLSGKLGIPGEDAKDVWPGLKFLHEVNTGARPTIGPNVLVIGGGDVAMDAARCARRLPGVKSVHLACLERREEMPAHSWEATEALEEGVIFHTSIGPTKILTENEKVTGVAFRACTRVFDEAGKFAPRFDDAQVSALAADTVIVTIGQGVDAAALAPVATGPGGRILADRETLATNVSGIFAGGDGVLGPVSLVDAMAHGHRAAQAIHRYLRGETQPANAPATSTSEEKLAPNPQPDAKPEPRRPMPQAAVGERLAGFREIDLGYSQEEAIAEARRCLSCGLCSECRLCEKACKPGAICHDMAEKTRTLQVGAVLLTPGFEEFDATKRGEFGYGFAPNVVTNVQFERILSASGPTAGHVVRPSDGKTPKRLAFIQCVGSRDTGCDNDYCSSVCCMAATKEAILAKEHEPDLDITIFFLDLRAFGKDFDRYCERAKSQLGVRYIRSFISRTYEMPGTKNLRVVYANDAVQQVEEEFDMVVLSLGLEPSGSVQEQAERLGVVLNRWGFSETSELCPLDTSRPGIFVGGAFQEPKDIPDTVMQASAAAARAMTLLAPARGTCVRTKTYPPERDVTDEPPRVGVFVCHCGSNIASVVDVRAVVERTRELPYVAFADHNLYTCADDTQNLIKDTIAAYRLNRVIVASCTPRTHEPIFRDTLRDAGLNPYLLEMANIRDQCSWVHSQNPQEATAKAIDLVRMAVSRVARSVPLVDETAPVRGGALVVGGGVAGMTAALAMADQGFPVHLVEKQRALGGTAREIHTTLDGQDVGAFLDQTIARVTDNPRITVHLGSRVAKVDGHVGSFTSRLLCDGDGAGTEIKHGVIVVATGATEQKPQTYGYGSDARVLTQLELSGRIGRDDLDLPTNATVVMIQCVEQRNQERPYCSRVCCTTAVKNALLLRARFPAARIMVLYRDMRTYGFRETAYRRAREEGVLFVRYEPERPPQLDLDGHLRLRLYEPAVGRDLLVRPDLLVLAAPVVPRADRGELSELLRVPLNADGFFLEAHMKLRPVDFASEGLFLCGTAHAPKFISETISQANAVAGRAASILSREEIPVSSQIAWVDPDKCISCMTCVHVCPYMAPHVGLNNKAEVQGTVCMGCGSCTSDCPARAITLRNYASTQIVAAIDGLLTGRAQEPDLEPVFPEQVGVAQPRWHVSQPAPAKGTP